MNKLNREAIIEGLRQIVRTLIIAVAPVIISGLQEGKVDTRTILVATAIAFLSGLNEWAHHKDIRPYESLGVKDAGLSPV